MVLRVLDLVNHATQATLDDARQPREGEGPSSGGSLEAHARRALGDPDARRAFFELLPAMLRDPELKAREDVFTEWVLARLIADAARDGVPAGLEHPVAAAYLALVHGLSMQVLVEPDTSDPLPALEAWSAAVGRWVAADAARGGRPAPPVSPASP